MVAPGRQPVLVRIDGFSGSEPALLWERDPLHALELGSLGDRLYIHIRIIPGGETIHLRTGYVGQDRRESIVLIVKVYFSTAVSLGR